MQKLLLLLLLGAALRGGRVLRAEGSAAATDEQREHGIPRNTRCADSDEMKTIRPQSRASMPRR